MYNFEDILYREGNGSKKWNEDYINKRFPNHKKPYYPLFIADMDYKLPKEINNRFIENINIGDFGYFDVLEKFNESICKWYENVNNINLNKDWIIPGIGTLASMNVVLKSMLKRDDKVLIFTPVYGPFKDITINNDLNLITQELDKIENRYYIDFKKLEKNIADNNINCILMCNPHNPSGRIWNDEELEGIVNICKRNDVLLVSDEVHGDIVVGDEKFKSMANYYDVYKNIIVCSSPNKTFNLAGLSSSYIITCEEYIKNAIELELKNNKLVINRVGYEFLTICYTYGDNWVKELRENIKDNIEIVETILNIKGINIMQAEAGYLLWIKLDGIKDSLRFVEELAKHTGVLVESGTRFVESEAGYIRLNVATSKSILKKSMSEFVKFYREFKEI